MHKSLSMQDGPIKLETIVERESANKREEKDKAGEEEGKGKGKKGAAGAGAGAGASAAGGKAKGGKKDKDDSKGGKKDKDDSKGGKKEGGRAQAIIEANMRKAASEAVDKCRDKMLTLVGNARGMRGSGMYEGAQMELDKVEILSPSSSPVSLFPELIASLNDMERELAFHKLDVKLMMWNSAASNVKR